MNELILVFFVSLLFFLFLGVPVSISIGASSLLYIILADIRPLIAIQRMFTGINSAALLAIPFFILAGDLMNRGGIADRLVKFATVTVGRRTGGMGAIGIVASMFFSCISGSGVATAAAISPIMVPAMVDNGYDKNYSAAVIAAASPLGIIFPPSIAFILYGVMSGSSIIDLFLVGIPAGIIVCATLLAANYFTCRKKGYKGITDEKIKGESLKAFKDAILALIMPFIIIAGVFAGIFTPTESAVVAVMYALTISLFIFRSMNFKNIPRILLSSATTSARIMFIMVNASLFAYVLASERIPQMIAAGLLDLTNNRIILLFLINILLLVIGSFMESGALIIIMVPLLVPVVQQLGVNLTHFGIIFTVNTAIGLLTPPVGMCIFTVNSVTGASVQAVFRQILPFVIAMFIALMIITYIPQSVMFILYLR